MAATEDKRDSTSRSCKPTHQPIQVKPQPLDKTFQVCFLETELFNCLVRKRTAKLELLLDLKFLKNCRNNGVYPKFINNMFNHKIKDSYMMHKRRIKCSKIFLIAAIKEIRTKLAKVELDLYSLHTELMNNFPAIFWDCIDIKTFAISYKQAKNKKFTLNKKFNNLMKLNNRYNSNLPEEHNRVDNNHNKDSVLNLSSYKTNMDDLNLLSLGLNYALPVSKEKIIEDLICQTENGVNRLCKFDIRNDVKYKLKEIIVAHKENFIRPNPFKTIRNLKDQKVVITRSDKGNNIVLLDRTNYEDKCYDLLKDETAYTEINKNPTSLIVKNIKHTVKTCSTLTDKEKSNLIPSKHILPRFYSLPKIHKTNYPHRPIVSKIGSIGHPMAKFVASKLSHLNNVSNYTLKNTKDFVTKIKDIKLDKNDFMASIDVTALYSNVPTQEALEVLEDKLNLNTNGYNRNEIKDLLSLTTVSLGNSYFTFNNRFYKQNNGLAMGCPLSSTLANLVMDNFESKFVTNTRFLKCYLRYVDDIFIIWTGTKQEFTEFITELNKQHPTLKFTHEIENEKRLPFLDVLVTRNDNNFNFDVYRKPFAKTAIPHSSSNHAYNQKIGCFSTLINRAYNICNSEKSLNDELNYLGTIAEKLNYPLDTVHKLNKKYLNKMRIKTCTSLETLKQSKNTVKYLTLPFLPGLTNKISGVLAKHNIKVAYKPVDKLIHRFNTLKDPITNNLKSGIYNIPCNDCTQCYIGQTRRNFIHRLKEHKSHTGYNDQKNAYIKSKIKPCLSAVANHVNETKHNINWEEAKIIKACDKNYLLDSYEKYNIFKYKDNMNIKDNNNIPNVWHSLIKRI